MKTLVRYLIETRKLNSIDPLAWMRDVLTRIATTLLIKRGQGARLIRPPLEYRLKRSRIHLVPIGTKTPCWPTGGIHYAHVGRRLRE